MFRQPILSRSLRGRLLQSSLLAAFGLGSLFAGSPVGSAVARGSVALNGAPAVVAGVPSFPVIDGDRIVTGSDGYAVISTDSDRLEIRNSTRAQVFAQRVELESGVVGSERLPVRLGDWTVESRDGDGWFVVSQLNDQRLIAAHRGDVVVHRVGQSPLLLSAGSYALQAVPGGTGSTQAQESDKDCDDKANDDKDKDKDCKDKGGVVLPGAHRRQGKAASGASRGVTIGGLSTTKGVALIAGIGAGATGLAFGLAGNDESTRSPSK